MASGHVNRANRPNTWLHRPSCKRDESPCQRGAVHTWHKADMREPPANVRLRGKSELHNYASPRPLMTLADKRTASGSS
jgi:hypothetical protein